MGEAVGQWQLREAVAVAVGGVEEKKGRLRDGGSPAVVAGDWCRQG